MAGGARKPAQQLVPTQTIHGEMVTSAHQRTRRGKAESFDPVHVVRHERGACLHLQSFFGLKHIVRHRRGSESTSVRGRSMRAPAVALLLAVIGHAAGHSYAPGSCSG